MRTYSFDHFKAEKPDVSKTNQGGANPSPPVEHTKPQVPPSEEGELHYGRQHARTAELYHKHREERERAEQMRVSGVQEEPMGGEAPPMEPRAAKREEPLLRDKADVEDTRAFQPHEAGREGLKDLAQQAVSSVLEAAKEAARGRPLTGARKLAGDAFSGVRRVAREVSARTSRSSQDEQQGETTKKRGPGKKR